MAVRDITRQRWQAAAAAARCAGPVSKPVLDCCVTLCTCWNAGLLDRVCASNVGEDRCCARRGYACDCGIVVETREPEGL